MIVRFTRWGIPTLLLVLAAAAEASSASSAALVVIRGEGARDCPDAPAVADRVALVAGSRLLEVAPSATQTWVQVEFVQVLGGKRAVISARGARRGTRTLDDVGPDCASLTDAVAVALAILLDPHDMPPERGPPPAKEENPVASERPQGTPPAVAVAAEAAAGGSIALLENTSPFVEAGVRLKLAAIDFVAGGGFVFPDRADFAGGGVNLSLGYGHVRACTPLLSRGQTRLEGCAGPMLGGLRGAGADYESNRTRWVFWSAACALIGLASPLEPWLFWSLRSGVVAPFARHGFSVDQGGTTRQAFELASVGGFLAFGIEANL